MLVDNDGDGMVLLYCSPREAEVIATALGDFANGLSSPLFTALWDAGIKDRQTVKMKRQLNGVSAIVEA